MHAQAIRSLALLLALAGVAGAQAPQDTFWETGGGTLVLDLDDAQLRAYGLSARVVSAGGSSAIWGHVSGLFPIDDAVGSRLQLATVNGRLEALFSGDLLSGGELELTRPDGTTLRLGDLAANLALDHGGRFAGELRDRRVTDRRAFLLTANDPRGQSRVDLGALSLVWQDFEVRIDPDWATRSGIPQAANARVGALHIEAPLRPSQSFFLTGGTDCGCQDDHADRPGLATILRMGSTLGGGIDSSGDLDVFAVMLTAGHDYRFWTHDLQNGVTGFGFGDDMDTILRLLDDDGTTQLAEDDDSGGGKASRIDHRAARSGVHYLEVRHYSGSASDGSYELSAEHRGGPAGGTTSGGSTPSSGSTASGATPAAGGSSGAAATGAPHTHFVDPRHSRGPDVIVGDLHDLSRFGRENGVTAFAVGTTSCNNGTDDLRWEENTTAHPVIAQNLYRLKDGRFEQVGMSWLKHGSYALSENLCFNDCNNWSGGPDRLGVHCSDPYSASLNGNQAKLGPRSQVDAASGRFPYPPADPGYDPTIGRRLQVKDADIDPAGNQGAQYFVEGHYVAADDAAAGNGLNNASYRPARADETLGGRYRLRWISGEHTRRQLPAIFAWREQDPRVVIQDVDVPGDGHFDVAYRVTPNADGTWHYEFAVFNMNAHRAAGSFSVPLPAGAVVLRPGFHDVDYHSGEPYDGTDWQATIHPDRITWATTPHATNPNANALRWSTLYNFRFDCDRAPGATAATLGLFTPGTPHEVQVAIEGPAGAPPPSANPDTTAPVFAGIAALAAGNPGEVRASWTAASDDRAAAPALRYRVYLARAAGAQDFSQPSATTSAGALSATLGNLTPGQRVYVVVRALDPSGNEDGNAVERDVLVPSGAPAVAMPTVAVTLTPAATSVSAGGSLRFTLALRNTSGQPQTVRGSVDLLAPGGTRHVVAGPLSEAIPAGDTRRLQLDVPVGAGAALGTYRVLAVFQDAQGGFDLDLFTFAVTP